MEEYYYHLQKLHTCSNISGSGYSNAIGCNGNVQVILTNRKKRRILLKTIFDIFVVAVSLCARRKQPPVAVVSCGTTTCLLPVQLIYIFVK